jgi:hypothetical protein
MASNPIQTQLKFENATDFRESYANSVQVRMSLWDFQLLFGRATSDTPAEVTVNIHEAIYLSPQQAKALANILTANVAQYEQTFGPVSLDARPVPASQVN